MYRDKEIFSSRQSWDSAQPPRRAAAKKMILTPFLFADAFVIRRANLDGTEPQDIIATSLDYGGPVAIDLVPPIPAASNGTLVALAVAILFLGAVLLRRSAAQASSGRTVGVVVLLGVSVNGLPAAAYEGAPDLSFVVQGCDFDSGPKKVPVFCVGGRGGGG